MDPVRPGGYYGSLAYRKPRRSLSDDIRQILSTPPLRLEDVCVKSPTICLSSFHGSDVEHLIVPDHPGPPTASPSCLSVPSVYGYIGNVFDISRRPSSTASSIFDLTVEGEQLERAIRENDLKTVGKILDLHLNKFSSHHRPSESWEKWSGGDPDSGESRSATSHPRSGTDNDASRKASLSQPQTLLPGPPGAEVFERRESSISGNTDAPLPAIFKNALHVAIQHRSLEVLDLLLNHGVDPNDAGINQCVDGRRFSSISEILLPAKERKDVRFLLTTKGKGPQEQESGTDPSTSNRANKSDRWLAPEPAETTALLSLGAQSGADAGSSTSTPQVGASRLEETGTGPGVTTDGTRAESCVEERADLLSFYNADTLLTLPPLFLAAAERCPAAVRLLLHYGATANVQDGHGTTPLHLCASVYFQNWECAVSLIECGARIHVKNNNGTSPSDLSPDLAKEQHRLLKENLLHLIANLKGCTGPSDITSSGTADPLKYIGARLFSRRGRINSDASRNVTKGTRDSSRKAKDSICVERESLIERDRASSLSSGKSRLSYGNFRFASSPPKSEYEDLDMDTRSIDPEKEPLTQEKQGLLQRMSSRRSSRSKRKEMQATEMAERNPLEETEKSLRTLIKLASNAECIPSLMDGLTTCMGGITGVVAEQAENATLEKLVSSLLNQIVQTCCEELVGASGNRILVLKQLTKLVHLCVDMLKGQHGLHFSALSTINRIIDVCITQKVYHLWKLESEPSSASQTTNNRTSSSAPPSHDHSLHIRADSGTPENPSSHVHVQLEKIMLQGSPKVVKQSPKHRPSWRNRPFTHQDSQRSIKSGGHAGEESSSWETSFIEKDISSDGLNNLASATRETSVHESTPLEVLNNMDPSNIVNLLQDSIVKHKKVNGNRHKCTPSVRLRQCTHHCIQILSARMLTAMTHGINVQHKIVNDGHLKILNDALDPNHDPHLLCLVLQCLACIAMTPSYHQALTEADIPDTLMQLLLPSDEWYYTNHSTKYARYVKYHAARILVYMGLFHRLGGRVDLFDLKAFDQTQFKPNPLLQMHHPEDAFIDQMALGKLLVRDSDGKIQAGSLEGLIAEIIKDTQDSIQPAAGAAHELLAHTLSSSSHRSHHSHHSGHLFLRATSSSGSAHSAHSTDTHYEDLSKRSFREYFFHAVPLIIHPIIILRVLCHKMFGHMLRRKTTTSPHNLSPPAVVESEACPPLRTSSMSEADKPPLPCGETSQGSVGSIRRKKSNLHVQIAMPDQEEEEELRIRRRRTRRAGSMDKHLLRIGQSLKKNTMAGGNIAMSLAIKAIGDSLMQPLDLNISPAPDSTDLDQADAKKRNHFKFPTLRKRSKSQGYIAGIGTTDSLESELSSSHKSSSHSIGKPEESELRDFEKELINLPVFEVDTHRMDQCTSPLLSRSNSVPEQLDHMHVTSALTHHKPSVPHHQLHNHHQPQPTNNNHKKSTSGRNNKGNDDVYINVTSECQISVTGSKEVSLPSGRLPSDDSSHGSHTNHAFMHQPRSTSKTEKFHMPSEKVSERGALGRIGAHRLIPPSSPPSWHRDGSPGSSRETSDGSGSRQIGNETIVFHFAAATPCESPSSYTEQITPPPFHDDSAINIKALPTSVSGYSLNRHPKPPPLSEAIIEAPRSSHVLRPATLLAPLNGASNQGQMSCGSSHSSLMLSPFSGSQNISLMVPSPGLDLPLHHLSVMKVVGTWVNTCFLDFECSANMKKEMKDFLNKMSSLGSEYKRWSKGLRERLKLEELDVSRTNSEAASDAENIHVQYRQLQRQIVTGKLPVSKEESSTLAGIQLHLEEAWPDDEDSAPESDGREQDHLLKIEDSDCNDSKGKKSILRNLNRPKRFASNRRTGRLTKSLLCIDEEEGTRLCFRVPDGRMAQALPPDYRTSRQVRNLIEEKQTKLWHTTYYDNEIKLKQLYIKICKNLPGYGCKLYQVKEILRGNTNRKVSRLLCIGSQKIALLDNKSKLSIHSHPVKELQEWSTGIGKNHDGLSLEFRGTRPWMLLAPSVENLKSVTATLWDVMGGDNRMLDSLPLQRDILNFDFGRRHVSVGGGEIEKCVIYSDELCELQKILHFPEEVAMRLTQTEYELFNQVPPMMYVRHVTTDLSKTPETKTQPQKDKRKPNIQDLIQRFSEVSSWITHIIVTQPTHEDRKAVLSCILRLLETCWNIGNFNGAVEILAGLKSDKLKPFWLSIQDEDLTVLNTYSDYLLSREPTKEYKDAVTRALDIPGCKVVPFFGGFLHDIRMIFSGIPSMVVIPSDYSPNTVEFCSDYNGEDRFCSRIGVGGLINMEKIHQAHLVLNDIHLFHTHAKVNARLEKQAREEESERDLERFSMKVDCDYDLDVSYYKPIKELKKEQQITMLTPKFAKISQNDMQAMHSGSTVVRWDTGSGHSSVCVLKLENDNRTLSWGKPNWSSLRGQGTTAPPTDYVFKGDESSSCSLPLMARYQCGPTVVEDVDDGYIDLFAITEVLQGNTSNEFHLITKRHNMNGTAKGDSCLLLMYGSTLAENKYIEFVMPSSTCEMWTRGLKKLILAAIMQMTKQTDRRILWLKEQYLQLFVQSERCVGPTPAEAIQVFGGRRWSADSVGPQHGGDQHRGFQRTASFVGGHNRTGRQRRNQYTLPVSLGRDSPSRPTFSNLHERFGHDSSTRQDGKNKSDHSSKEKGRSKATNKSHAESFYGTMSSGSKGDLTVIKGGKHANLTVYEPKALTFNFAQSGYHPRDPLRLGLGAKPCDPNKPITHSTNMDFTDFVDLFKCFSLRTRKDLRDLFEQFATSQPSIEQKMPSEILCRKFSRKLSGLITRNGNLDMSADSNRRKLCDALAVASIVSNSAGLYSGKQKCLGIQELREFLDGFQEQSMTETEIMEIIHKHEPDLELRGLCKLSFEGFARYLMDKDNYAFINEEVKQEAEDMDHPLSHYFIKSSHNTYLTGYQLKGDSSVELYSQVLLTGCRCVELDCWDGDDGSPIIYHGHTLTSKISFKEVIQAVNKSAFITSPYPVILSIENHCSIPQQQKMAQILIETLGDKLLKNFLEEDLSEEPILPSPNVLKHKILIKNKKNVEPDTPLPTKQKFANPMSRLNSISMDTSNYEDFDDEDEDDDYIPDEKEMNHNLRRSGGSQDSQQTDNLILSNHHSQSDQSFEQINECPPQSGSNNRHSLPIENKVSTPGHVRAKSLCELRIKQLSEGDNADVSETETQGRSSAHNSTTTLDDKKKSNSLDNLLDESTHLNAPILDISRSSSLDHLENSKPPLSRLPSLVSTEETVSLGSRRPSSALLVAEPKQKETRTSTWLSHLTMWKPGKMKDTSAPDLEVVLRQRSREHSPKSSTRSKESKDSKESQESHRQSSEEGGKSLNFVGDKSGRPKSDVPSGSEYVVDDDDRTPKVHKRKKIMIAQELSDIVVYTQAVKYRGLVLTPVGNMRQRKAPVKKGSGIHHSSSPVSSLPGGPDLSVSSGPQLRVKLDYSHYPTSYQMSSVNENKGKQICRKNPAGVINHTSRQLMRVYPAGMRIDSSNFNPVAFWACGIQLSAMNYQTEDIPMAINSAMFEQNSGSGYVLKPRLMWDRNNHLFNRFDPYMKDYEGVKPAKLTIHLISGQYVCQNSHHSSAMVEIEIIGIPVDCTKHKSKVITRNSVNPIWNEMYTFHIVLPELAFIRFSVSDMSNNHVAAQRIVAVNCLRAGYRHLRLRSLTNAPLELSTLFLFTRYEEAPSDELLPSGWMGFSKEERHDPRKQRGLVTKLKEAGDLGKQEKECIGQLVGPPQQHKRRTFFISVFGVTPDENYMILNVTQETTAQEVLQQALLKAAKSDKFEEYILIEEVQQSWETKEFDKGGTAQRILAMEENVMLAQNRWRGNGRFLMRKANNRADRMSLAYASPEWDSDQQVFLACIYNVSTDPQTPYTIIQATVTATAQDIITQAMMKAKRPEDPRNFVLVEEVGLTSNFDPHTRYHSSKLDKKILADDNNVYQAQHAWKTTTGKFVLMDRSKASTEIRRKKVDHMGRLGKIMRFATLGRDKRDKTATKTDNTTEVNNDSPKTPKARKFTRNDSDDQLRSARPRFHHPRYQMSAAKHSKDGHLHQDTKAQALPRLPKLLSK